MPHSVAINENTMNTHKLSQKEFNDLNDAWKDDLIANQTRKNQMLQRSFFNLANKIMTEKIGKHEADSYQVVMCGDVNILEVIK